MKEQWVTITMEVPLSAIDFSDCGDGCGQVDGLKYAKYKGAQIERFASDDIQVAEEAMHESLGEPVGRFEIHKRRWTPPADIVAEERERVLNDPLSKARHG